MVFWRHKKNDPKDERVRDSEDKLMHHEGEALLDDQDKDDDSREGGTSVSLGIKQTLDDANDDKIAGYSVTPTPDQALLDDYSSDDNSNNGGWWGRLTKGLSKSTGKITRGLSDLVTKKKLDEDMLDDLEDLLITADIGPQTAADLVAYLRKERFGKEITIEEIKSILAERIDFILEPVAQELSYEKPETGPFTVVVVGVNGAGKTTTIGKIAHQLVLKDKKSVLIAAGDTFRAAAVEQLQEWGRRARVPVLSKEIGADSAAVAYEAYQQAKEKDKDVLLIDTAGRLHNKSNLMAELEKIIRVLKKQDESLPHAVLLVLDATTGQNAHAQVETFRDMINVNGLVVTKLDGSAKAGVLVALADRFSLPVYGIGVGEQAEDLQSFHPREYANALLGIDDDQVL